MNKSTIALCAALAIFGMVFASLAGIMADENTAAAFEKTTGSKYTIGDDSLSQYGDPTVIEISPGFKWTYKTEFPSDISGYTTVSFIVNTDNIAKLGTDGRTLTAAVPSGAAVGKVYDIVVKASMTSPVAQSAYQYVQLKVITGLTVGGTIDNILKGSSIEFTPQGSSAMGAVTWAVNGKLPDGLSFDGTRITGTPTKLGVNTVSLKATANGESKALDATFTVFSVMNGASGGRIVDETINAFGSDASSTGIENPSDLNVRWNVTSGTLPDGFTLDQETGSITGHSSKAQKVTVTITGTPTADGCPAQSVSKNVTIVTENELTLTAGDRILTYKGNSSTVTSKIAFPSTSTITWSSDSSSASVSDGVVSVKSPTTVGMDQIITVTAKTAYGQTKTVEVPLSVEDTLTLSGDSTVSAIAGKATAFQFSATGGSSNSFAITTTPSKEIKATISSVGLLTVDSATAIQDAALTIRVQSAAGQAVYKNVKVDIYSELMFTSEPTCGAIAYAL